MKWLGRAVECGSWPEAETDLPCTEPYWNLCFKLGLLRRALKALRPLQIVLDRPIRCRPFRAESVETFELRRSFLAHLLVKRFTVGGAREAGAWTGQQIGSALLRSASEGLEL